MLDHKIHQIDAVLNWVDGNDKQWQDKFNQHSKTKKNFDQTDLIRFNSIGEIDIAITSLIKFAPFLSNIFLVTDKQKPKSLDKLKQIAKEEGINLELIDHTVIFKGYERFLPSFNSRSIENMMFKIPNLSEHFIYLNDDFFLMRESKPNDFFIDGKPIIRGQWEEFHENRTFRKLYHSLLSIFGKNTKRSPSFKKAQQTSAKLAGTKKYVRRFHTPVSMRKSTITKFFDEHNVTLEENIKYRFRNETQFLVTSLSEHLEIKQNTYVFQKNTKLTYFRSYKNLNQVKRKLNHFLKNKNQLFVTCQSLELASSEIQTYILKWIDSRFDDKS